jgi:hypothetical protein
MNDDEQKRRPVGVFHFPPVSFGQNKDTLLLVFSVFRHDKEAISFVLFRRRVAVPIPHLCPVSQGVNEQGAFAFRLFVGFPWLRRHRFLQDRCADIRTRFQSVGTSCFHERGTLGEAGTLT